MLKNYIKIAWRQIRKNRLYSAVNLFGLTVGLTSCLLIGLYITHELSYDRFNKNAGRIARVTMEYSMGGTASQVATTGTKVGPQFQRSFPAVQAFVRTFHTTLVVNYEGQPFTDHEALYADSAFFKVFTFPLVSGDPNTALSRPDQVVITESAAKKYFPQGTSPIGKLLLLGKGIPYTISAIAQDPPLNSQVRFDLLVPFSSFEPAKTEQWWTANYVTYLLLSPDASIPQLQKQVQAYMQTPAVRSEAGTTGSDYLTYHLEPLTRVHLYSNLNGLDTNGSILYVYILGGIALLILIIACVNYTNLATAQAVGRSGEIGIRKVLGAANAQIFRQHLGESFFLVFFSALLALASSILLMPLFNYISGKTLNAGYLLHPGFLLLILVLIIGVSLVAGFYPAVILSNTKLSQILKKGFRVSSSSVGLRKTLIVVQFVISVFLISSTLVIRQQMHFIQNKKLGYDRDHVVVLPIDRRMHADYDNLKRAFAANPNILSVAGATGNPTNVEWGDGITADNGHQQVQLSVNCIPADPDFIKTMGMQLVAGSDFSPSDFSKHDTSNDYKNYHHVFIINQTAAKMLGWTPEQALGKTISKGTTGEIKGVVKDFHFASLHQPIGPLVLFLDTVFASSFYVRIADKNTPATLHFLESVWKERVPYRPFEFHFLDEDYNRLYSVETQTSQVFAAFAITAIVLACLGLFALAAFTTMQRTKEIGIRKVLGASTFSITGLISADFLRLVLFAVLIACPLAWFGMHHWLQEFAYRISISWWIFLLAAVIALLVALLTVSWQAIRAALANPVKSLRTE